jgi:hypothetical protein
MREDFVVLYQRGYVKPSERLYQLLIQSLPDLSEKSLLDDFQRTAMLVDTNKPQPDSLIWKYHVSLRNELNHRADKRVAQLLEKSGE